ncbi:MAG: arsenic metallochaperone ArsD family protein [Desulfonatronovibrio sp.]
MPKFELEIYIPFMGCACGPSSSGQDEQDQEFQDILLKLKEKLKNDVSCAVYALNLHLQQFKSRPQLSEILQNQGTKGLPAIFINDKLVVQGRYPSLSEMEELLYNG